MWEFYFGSARKIKKNIWDCDNGFFLKKENSSFRYRVVLKYWNHNESLWEMCFEKKTKKRMLDLHKCVC